MASKSPVEAIRAARNNLVEQRRLVIEDLAKVYTHVTPSDMQKLVHYQEAIDALDAALADEQAHGIT